MIEQEQGIEVLAPLIKGVHSLGEISPFAAYVSPVNFKQFICAQVAVRNNLSTSNG